MVVVDHLVIGVAVGIVVINNLVIGNVVDCVMDELVKFVKLLKLLTLTLDSFDSCVMPDFNVLSDDSLDCSCDEPIIAHDTTDSTEEEPDEVKLTSPVLSLACADCELPIGKSDKSKKTSLA